MQGSFITIYGVNNMGKSTHAKKLVNYLESKGLRAKYIKYPIYDLAPTGPFLNEVLRGDNGQKISEEELQMWFVLNRYQYQPQLKQDLADGVTVVAEDYTGTGIAWGTAKGANQEWLEKMNENLVKEDLAIFIHGERAVSAKEAQHIHEQNDGLVERCRQVHERLADQYGWQRVELQPTKEETAKLMRKAVDDFLERS